MGTNLVKFSRDTARDVKVVARGWRWGRRPQVPRSAEPYVLPKESTVFPTKWARTPAAIALREVLQKGALNSVLRWEVNPQVSGLDSLLKLHGPALIVANHSSHLDTPLVLCTLPDAMRRKTAVAAAADYFFDTWWRATASAIVFNTFPIERRGGKLSATPGDLLADGWNVVVFPEGTRSPDGWMERFRMGAAYLAVEHGVPVIPVGIKGSFAAMPRGRGWPVPGRPTVAVRYGDPLYPLEGESAREFAPKISAAVSALLDEEATTWWEARRRVATGASPSQSGPDAARWRRVWESTAPIKTPAQKHRAWK
ncbi:lysophospholipid acyltransferase family protein [Kribbella sp. VKM Ac-2568]|uniref:lysophospholipid acyltransferase family protein n=1 Tax=Kribbella sp. VKM Ac-2568 TaxID=2512219 RepID=UPI00104339BB|nr:lysophospholipid acyltransferase family protein [Kribbella sp. VKM Ac-2568]TCM50201.1 1-acyl-sn-glycerol-3-phosphate acyltransferase [Kribbella sp. VKM Ac-2568]